MLKASSWLLARALTQPISPVLESSIRTGTQPAYARETTEVAGLISARRTSTTVMVPCGPRVPAGSVRALGL